MKKYILFTILFLFSFVLSGCSFNKKEPDDLETIINRGYIIVGVKSDSAPFGYYKNGKRAGFDIELSKKIAYHIFNSDEEDKIKFVNITPQNRISKLNSGEVDILVATMSINEKRKLVINFSDPYYITGQKLMVKKDSKISDISRLGSKDKLVVVMGTTGEKVARNISPNTTLVGAKSYNEAFNYLQNSQATAILGDEAILSGYLTKKYKILNRCYSREYYAVAVRKQKNSAELLNKINIAVAEFLDNKKIKLKNINITVD